MTQQYTINLRLRIGESCGDRVGDLERRRDDAGGASECIGGDIGRTHMRAVARCAKYQGALEKMGVPEK